MSTLLLPLKRIAFMKRIFDTRYLIDAPASDESKNLFLLTLTSRLNSLRMEW